MTVPPTVRGLVRSAWRDYRRAWPALFVFELLFKLLQTWLLVPAVAVVLAVIMARSGRVAVTNWDILDFAHTPAGLLYAAVLGTAVVVALLFEQAGIMALAAAAVPGGRPNRRILLAATRKTLRIARLGALKVALLALTAVPFVLLAALTYAVFLSRQDIYFYLQVRPPAFWLAAGTGGFLLAAALAAGTVLYVRWSLALPILMFESVSAGAALRASRDRVRGVAWRVGLVLVGWQVVVLSAGAALMVGFRLLAAAVLDSAGETPVVRILTLLIAQGMLLATWSFAAVVGQSLLTRRVYLARSEELGLLGPEGADGGPDRSPWVRRLAYLALMLALVGPLSLWVRLQAYLEDRPPVGVTAHRGHARAAPENTLSAIRKAIESGADYAEVDVQQTADGVVVLLHDRDLKRVAGDPRRLGDLTYEEVRQLDVGSWFAPAFAGERVPTLVEAIRLARGRIKLNVELKFFGPDRRLAEAVAGIIRDEHFESECLVTSFEYDALQEVRQRLPGVRTGFIVAHALGDVSRLDVDVLNVRADHLSDDLLGEAHRRGREVHVWTVNDPREMVRFIKRGVDNILTSDPDLLIRVRDEWAALSGPERLVLTSRLLLGLDR
jgi:glycerophosphoryl diester phosphodiesterase